MRQWLILALIVGLILAFAACSESNTSSQKQIPTSQSVPPRSVQAVQTPQQTQDELKQNRLSKIRLSIAVKLQQTLSDGGYDDISVGEVGPKLILRGDIFKTRQPVWKVWK
jgi:hypothetical protein